MAAVFCAAVGLAVAYAQTRTPHFVSTATIQIERLYPGSASINDLFGMFGQFDLYYQTQLEALRSRGLAEAYLVRMKALKIADPVTAPVSGGESPEGKARSATTPPDRSPEDQAELREERHKAALIDSILGRVKVVPVKGTQMIDVTMGADDPLVARRMLQTYLETYVEDSRKKRSDLANRVKTLLDRELERTRKQFEEAKEALLAFTREHGIVSLDKGPNQTLREFDRATEDLLRTKAERLDIEAASIEKDKVLPARVTSEYLQSLKSQLAQLKSEYTGMKAIYSPDYFKMALVRNKIKTIEETIAEVERSALSSALGAAKKKEEISEKEVEKTRAEAINQSSLNVQYGILKKALDSNEKLYAMLLEKSKQVDLNEGTMGYEIVVTSPATLPVYPVSPHKGNIIFMGAVIGLLAGIMLAVVLEYVDNTVQSTQEIQDRLNLPILGVVPKLVAGKGMPAGTTNGTPLEFTAHYYPSSPFTDAVRIIQNAATACMPQKSGASIVITSALPLEGKTMLSVVMATVVASEQKRVLVVDGDLRNPRIHQVFQGQPGDIGLSDLLTGKVVKLKEAVRESNVPGLYYLPAGFIPDNPVALLKTDRLRDILEACRKVFDVVIVDAPPLLGLVDARILASQTEGLILVTRAGHTPIELLRQAKEAVYQADIRLLGIVLNMADQRSAGYGGYYSGSKYYNRYYHRYHRDKKIDDVTPSEPRTTS